MTTLSFLGRSMGDGGKEYNRGGIGDAIPARLSDDGRTATWNPAMTRAAQVLVRVQGAGGEVESRRSMNSGRARVREGERIVGVLSAPAE